MIGTKERPLTSDEPMKVARDVVLSRFSSPEKKRGLWFAGGEFWEWYGGRWQIRTVDDIEDATWLYLEDSWLSSGADAMERFAPTQRKVEEVVRAMQACIRLPHDRLPVWLGEDRKVDAEGCVAFKDVVVDVFQTAKKGVEVVYPRTEDWFDSVVLPGEWAAKEKAPEYEEKLKEWMEGDEKRAELLLQTMGYFLLPWKGYPFWWVFYGVPQSGKSTNMKLLKGMLGHPGFCGTDLSSIAGDFGLEGITHSRVLCINEVYELESRVGERVSSLVKSLMGGDEVSVNRKHQKIQRGQVRAAVVMVSNEIPKLPNKGQGLSAKMKPIVFKRSWAGQQDVGLERRLMAELGGIGRLFTEAAIRLESKGSMGEKFVLDEVGHEAIHRYQVVNNPLDEFLMWGFVKNPNGFVAKSLIRNKFDEFERENRVKLNIPRNTLVWKLISETTWGLSETRPHGDERAIAGLSLKPRKELLCEDDDD